MKKLNMRGFSHHLVLVAFVLVFAVAGVGYLVATHAMPAPAGSHSKPRTKVVIYNEGFHPLTSTHAVGPTYIVRVPKCMSGTRRVKPGHRVSCTANKKNMIVTVNYVSTDGKKTGSKTYGWVYGSGTATIKIP